MTTKFTQSLVIASHSYDEAITNCIFKNREHFYADISIVLLDDLLFNYEIYDELNDSFNIVRWYKNNKLFISNQSHKLLNRILYFPSGLFVNFAIEDQEYAQREFEAYMGFALNAFIGVSNNCTNGLCEQTLSLPQQWNIAANADVRIPNYYWGPSNFNALDSNIMVNSDIYNYLNWQVDSNILANNNHIFSFEKPAGEPVFVMILGSKILITADFNLTLQDKNKITSLAKQISMLIPYFIAEILFFYDGINIVFGCINTDLIRSVKNINFDAFVIKHLINEFLLCAN